MDTQQQNTETAAAAPAHSPVPVPEGTVSAWSSMIEQIPDAESGAGYDRILSQLATATDEAALNAPWQSDDMERLVGLPLTIRSVVKSASDFGGGLPWFLIVDAVDETTGETITATTGSVNIVAQLTRAYVAGLFPVRAVVRVADKPTRNGFYPQRLEFLPRKAAKAADNGGAA